MIGPSPPGNNGHDRDQRGRFTPGNSAGKGNPHHRRVGQLRSALLKSITDADMEKLGRTLLDLALGGDVQAAKVLLAYSIGGVNVSDHIERIEQLERELGVSR